MYADIETIRKAIETITIALPGLQESIDMSLSKAKVPLSTVTNKFLSDRTLALSPHTIRDYDLTLRRLVDFTGDPLLSEIDSGVLRNFLKTIPGKHKNLKNAHTGLSAFWTYLIEEEYLREHIVRKIKVPKPEEVAIIPYSSEEMGRMLEAASTNGRCRLRNVAILKTMLDTGVRASELTGLKIRDLEGTNLKVFGKGAKQRYVPLSASPLRAIMDYLDTRKAAKRTEALFLSETGNPLDRFSLRQIIERIAAIAHVDHAFPHRFRHTFAINYLINGGDPYTLQAILGHSTLDMVKRYLHIVQRDITTVHRRASPVVNWKM